MAVTKIWNIKGNANTPLDYVMDSDKTQREFSEGERQALADVIAYAANEDKTEQLFYTTGINCNVDCARDQFDTAKLQFVQEGGNVAFHAYQSFAPGEVTPDEAHAIGVELARELWGDRFQMVVATHVNTNCVHNHIVINSVSYLDGYRFHDCKDTYKALRETSDRICREHGLSVIDNPKGRGVSQYLYKTEKAGGPTRYNIARQAIDEAIELSLDVEDFKDELKRRGYNIRFEPNRKYWTIVPPGWKKPIRIHQLGDAYTQESIERRIYDNDPVEVQARVRRSNFRPARYNLRRRIDNIMGRSGLEKLYLRYCYELGYLPKYRQNPTRLHILLKEDLLKCDQYSEQAKLLAKYHISTGEELAKHAEAAKSAMKTLGDQRDELRRFVKRVGPAHEIEAARAEIAELTSEIKKLRREVKVCKAIEERSDELAKKLQIVDRETRRKEEMSR